MSCLHDLKVKPPTSYQSPAKVPPIVCVPVFIFLLFPHQKRETVCYRLHFCSHRLLCLRALRLLFYAFAVPSPLSHPHSAIKEQGKYTFLHACSRTLVQTDDANFALHEKRRLTNQAEPDRDVLDGWWEDIYRNNIAWEHAGFGSDKMKHKRQNEREWCSSKRSAWWVCVCVEHYWFIQASDPRLCESKAPLSLFSDFTFQNSLLGSW